MESKQHTHKPQEIVDAVNSLQLKFLQEYKKLLAYITKGKQVDYDFLLEELNLLDNVNNFDNRELYFLLQLYNSNEWVVQY